MDTITEQPLAELGQAANQVLSNVRKMAGRGDSRFLIESYLRDCRDCFLKATEDARYSDPGEVLTDMARAIRYSHPNAELLGALAVLAGVSHQHNSRNFRTFALGAQQRVRAEIRDHLRIGVCDPDDIRLGAELALSSLQPLAAA